jgi:hypothetical protein
MNQDLNPGEQVIDTWTMLYIAPNGGKYNGMLKVTNRRLLYHAKMDASVLGVIGERGAEGGVIIDKSDITTIDVVKKLLSKKAILTLEDGSKHSFDYGAMNIDKCVAAIERR